MLLLKPCLAGRTNGGEISLFERLEKIQSWGAKIEAHLALNSAERENCIKILKSLGTPLQEDESYSIGNLHFQIHFSPNHFTENLQGQSSTEESFLKILNSFQPDVVWTHMTDYFSTSAALKWDSKKTWVVFTDNEFPRPKDLTRYPSLIAAYEKIETAIVASPFMRRAVKEAFPQSKPLLISNPVEVKISTYEWKKDLPWLFVNPVAVKGIDFVLSLAHDLPSEQFLFVGNWHSEAPRNLPANVKFLERQSSLREVFKSSKGLLMPSVWEEAFGRIILEAMAADVPVISSNRGNLPATVGDGGASLPLELESWKGLMLEMPSRFEDFRRRGRKRYQDYRATTEKRFTALRRLLGLATP